MRRKGIQSEKRKEKGNQKKRIESVHRDTILRRQ